MGRVKDWFGWPKLITTLTLFLMFYTAFSLVVSSYLFIVFYCVIALWCVYKGTQLNRVFRKRKEISNKKWLLEEIIFKQAGGVGLIFSSQIFNVVNYSVIVSDNNYMVSGMAMLFTLMCLISYISFHLIPDKAEKLLKEVYPGFSL